MLILLYLLLLLLCLAACVPCLLSSSLLAHWHAHTCTPTSTVWTRIPDIKSLFSIYFFFAIYLEETYGFILPQLHLFSCFFFSFFSRGVFCFHCRPFSYFPVRVYYCPFAALSCACPSPALTLKHTCMMSLSFGFFLKIK
uniref:T. congolense-specific, cell surface-expressed gene family n=1 Tax=Trypanosoma congolense (strain IL3000) TaxID=1068625 RepID=G0V2E9_TRYCI|nr:hypothetical protein, unlikely [Trypanosoma congolense IL3000]